MKIRHVLIGASAVLLVSALLPASSAMALDDLVCIDERTEQVSHGFETTVHHYCNRWQWTPPKTSHTPTEPGGEHDPDGGKGGGTPGSDTCESARQDLAETKAALDLVNKQLNAANIWLGNALNAERNARIASAAALDAWERAEANVDFFFTAYATANGVDMEIEVEIKRGVTITRPVVGFRPNTLLEFGTELAAAMSQERTTRAARDAAAKDYLEIGEDLNDARSAVANLRSQQAALNEVIKRLTERLGRC
ncbi:hypothetical protein [Luedemannella flava]